MKNPELGKHLREYRKKNNYSVDYVIECLKKDYNISYSSKSLYSWEVGQNQPPADILLILCKIYKISNILEAMGYDNPNEDTPFLLSHEEKEIIMKLRSHHYFKKKKKKLMEIDD